ncbi:chorismate mutase [bacterium F11]|nr:chorismate mutase [bacterium F11]
MSNDQKLEKQRKRIDLIDTKLLELLTERADVAKKIGQIKARSGSDIYVSDREVQILNRMLEANKGPLTDDDLEDIFQTVLTACRSLQKRLEVGYLGPEATFTHQSAIKHFGRNTDYKSLPSIKDVFEEVEKKRADFGVVPIENSTEGVVNHTLDMFIKSPLVIVAERQDRISHDLLSLSPTLRKIKRIYSHPQALAQCRGWLEVHLPGVVIQETNSTADAAIQATLDASCAAVASGLAGQIYHLKTISREIQDTVDNATRFLVIGRESPPASGHDKTSILFSIKDRVGALFEMLQPFRRGKINLTKIESRPTKKKAWEYIFYVDLIGHQSEKRVQKALSQLRHLCKHLKILGSYPYRA